MRKSDVRAVAKIMAAILAKMRTESAAVLFTLELSSQN